MSFIFGKSDSIYTVLTHKQSNSLLTKSKCFKVPTLLTLGHIYQ